MNLEPSFGIRNVVHGFAGGGGEGDDFFGVEQFQFCRNAEGFIGLEKAKSGYTDSSQWRGWIFPERFLVLFLPGFVFLFEILCCGLKHIHRKKQQNKEDSIGGLRRHNWLVKQEKKSELQRGSILNYSTRNCLNAICAASIHCKSSARLFRPAFPI